MLFEQLQIPTTILATLYMSLSLYTGHRLILIHRSFPGMNTRKLFVMTIFLTTILRFMSFISMIGLSSLKNHNSIIKISDDDNVINKDKNSQFLDKAALVLFDFPDFCGVSAYVLLLVVWAENIISARRHWMSSIVFKRMLMISYMIFNIFLYTLQVSLYSLLFVPSIDQESLTSVIYLTLTVINLSLPCIWLAIYMYLSILFAGFPFASLESKNRLHSLTRLGVLWTIARLAWGFTALASVLKGWLVVISFNRTEYYYIFLILIFLFSEIIPIFISLQESLLSSFSEKRSNNDSNNDLNNSIKTPIQRYNNETDGISMTLINKIKNGLHQDLDSYGSMIIREKEKGRYLELTGANLHIASMDLEEQTLQQSNGYIRDNDHHIIPSLTRNRASLLSFQSDDISMYTANEHDERSDDVDETIYSDTFTATDSDIVSRNSSEANISPKKSKRFWIF